MPFILCHSRPLLPIIFLFLLLLSKVALVQAQVTAKLGLSLGGVGLGITPVQQQIALGSVTEELLGSCGNKPTGPINATLCDYETIESVNNNLGENLQILLQVPFFKYVQMELYRGCPFWEDDGMCMELTCSIEHVDESQVPEEWRIKTLSRVNPVINTYHELNGCYYRESDFCFLEDPKSGEYYDLTTIPERYNGYTGASPHQIWCAIYEENFFTVPITWS
ncbi:endoplasmic reticulum oxidoreductin 1 [Gymnopus androsaceus JB14]|uniref:Endoplasmic reticulum oxidoreductin 1 n=1 Tax=Gymnopus androsaceus JB14 TaxID=1447944 RepID=A0A6A4HW56_9AGAR|nr:endoplasmic reticulum oxidoreductin 1 [Gymnopus androsaceus JB14]